MIFMANKINDCLAGFVKRVIWVVIFFSLTASFLGDGLFLFDRSGIHPLDGEQKVYGRLAKSRQDGIFSEGGLLGWCGKEGERYNQEYQLRSYAFGNCSSFTPYKSQSGGQGMLFSLMDRVGGNLWHFRVAAAVFMAAAIVLWLAWVYDIFGGTPVLFVLIGILSSRWTVLLGDNIVQMLGFDVLIMSGLFWAHQIKVRDIRGVAFAFVLLKCFFSGAEYITSAVLMAFIPYVFYKVQEGVNADGFFRGLRPITEGVVLAITVSAVLLVIQIVSVSSLDTAVRHIVGRTLVRSNVYTVSETSEFFITQTSHGVMDDLSFYLGLKAMTLAGVDLSFGQLVLFYFVVNIVALRVYAGGSDRPVLALSCATLFSILCPVSWIIIMKGHAMVLPYIDPIVWDLPYTMLGAALTGVVFNRVFLKPLSDIKKTVG
jgi:hypothetical protein